MKSDYARRAGARFVLHGVLCGSAFLCVGLLTGALAAWTSLEATVLSTILALGVAGCAGYAYYLLKRYRVRCPDCEYEGAHFARDMQNRMLLICPQCGLRSSTGRKVIAESPTAH